MLGIASLFPRPIVEAARANVGPCRLPAESAGSARDVGPAIQACIDASAPGSEIMLAPGSYLIRTPIIVTKPITLATKGMAPAAAGCGDSDPRCATLMLRMRGDALAVAPMPIDIRSGGVTLRHLILAGNRIADPVLSTVLCRNDRLRSLGGGVRAAGDGITVAKSVFRDFACYTAFEFANGRLLSVTENRFVRNGTHDRDKMWSDGLTIHDGSSITVANNRFEDNTDVQLIFGGCTDCSVTGNVLRHGGPAGGGAFAELMIHAWPGATSGQYRGSRFSGNDIDCGVHRRCGFGIMIGAAPWYDAPTAGGEVSRNRVVNAMLAVNVDGLSGPMTIAGNDVRGFGGSFPSSCGPRRVRAAINVAPPSRRFVGAAVGTAASGETYAGCILNFGVVR